MSTDRFDVVVVGAGIVGATLANALCGSGLRIALLDKSAPPRYRPDTYDLRVSAIALASERVFKTVGVWAEIAARRISPFRKICVWDAGSNGSIEFDAAQIGVSHLGHIVENNLITCMLHERLSRHEHVVVINRAVTRTVSAAENHVTVELEGDGQIEATVLVGADGSSSWVRGALGIEADTASYAQRAIVAQVSTSEFHNHVAWQRFLASGPLAFLPLADGTCSIVWSCNDSLADKLLAMGDPEFAEELARAFENRLGEIVTVGPRQSFPLIRLHAQNYTHTRSVLIGDAAHTVHPLAGQGANLGIADAAALAEVIIQARNRRRDIGAFPTLRRYERWRKSENRLMLDILHALKLMFGSELLPVRRVRGIGLRMVDAAGPLKHVIMRQAMGLSGDLPRLARGQSLSAEHL